LPATPTPEIVLIQFPSFCDTFGIHVAGEEMIARRSKR